MVPSLWVSDSDLLVLRNRRKILVALLALLGFLLRPSYDTQTLIADGLGGERIMGGLIVTRNAVLATLNDIFSNFVIYPSLRIKFKYHFFCVRT